VINSNAYLISNTVNIKIGVIIKIIWQRWTFCYDGILPSSSSCCLDFSLSSLLLSNISFICCLILSFFASSMSSAPFKASNCLSSSKNSLKQAWLLIGSHHSWRKEVPQINLDLYFFKWSGTWREDKSGGSGPGCLLVLTHTIPDLGGISAGPS